MAMDATTDPALTALERMIDRLHARGRLRVWSLVVTVFGDAVAPRGGQAPLSLLQDLMMRLRVEPGAVRTAMSRLAADHWVSREREGRNSFYRLADEGRHAFDLATRRIYASGPPAWDGRWIVAVAPSPGEVARRSDRDRDMREIGFVPTGPGSWIKPHTEGGDPAEGLPSGLLVIAGAALRIPEGVTRLWSLDGSAAGYRTLCADLSPLARALAGGAVLAPLDAMAARILVNHGWRRLVLRDPGLPAALLPQDWPGEEARALVRDLYARLAAPSETWLDTAGLPAQARPERFRGRFGGI
jgi:phenylacetic acid degradation operon negative regulatory protein